MPLLFSKTCEYAMQAVLYLAEHSGEKPVLLRDISNYLKSPHHFMSKVMQRLTALGYVRSTKGINGGFALAISPHSITLYDIVRSIDGEYLASDACLLGYVNRECDNPCTIHNSWEKSKRIIIQTLSTNTIADLIKQQ